MRNLSEDIMNKYLTGQCSEEEIIEVNAWMKESEENARQLFRMEEIYHFLFLHINNTIQNLKTLSLLAQK